MIHHACSTCVNMRQTYINVPKMQAIHTYCTVQPINVLEQFFVETIGISPNIVVLHMNENYRIGRSCDVVKSI